MADREIKTFKWKDILDRVEKNQGVSKKTVDESFKVVKTEISAVCKTERPMKDGAMTVIKTPLGAVVQQYFPSHVVTDAKGKKFEVSESIGVTMVAPRELVTDSNDGFTLTKKEIKE